MRQVYVSVHYILDFSGSVVKKRMVIETPFTKVNLYSKNIMLDKVTLNDFSKKVNKAYQEYCIWLYTNNEYAKYQVSWNEGVSVELIETKEFLKNPRDHGCRYKNFLSVVLVSLQHAWILSLARLFDPPYHPRDRKKENPRLSLSYISELVDDTCVIQLIDELIKKYQGFSQSIKILRDNYLAHNDINCSDKEIKAMNDLFEDLDNIISVIKQRKPHLKDCNNPELKYTDALSQCGVVEIFEKLK